MKMYSPSSTLSFQQCPRKWQLDHQGWRLPYIGNNNLAAAFGAGFSRGMELYYKHGADQLEWIITEAQGTACALIDSRLAQGATLGSREEKTSELLPKRLEKAIRSFHKESPFPADWHNFMTELAFPDHGNCRVDLLLDSDFGPTILDFKTKVTAKDYIVDNFMFDAETSWQLHHYVYAARAMRIPVSSTAICLVIVEPFEVRLEQWVVDEDRQARWLEDAIYWWGLMEKAEEQIARCPSYILPGVGDHRNKYGLCEMYKGCTEPDGFANMAVWYQKVERHK